MATGVVPREVFGRIRRDTKTDLRLEHARCLILLLKHNGQQRAID